MKRIFIAINLPKEIKQEITAVIEKINPEEIPDNFNFRWISDNNWHLTISFLGEQTEETIKIVSKIIEESAEKFPTPFIEFEKIILGPSSKNPRMIWLISSQKTSQELGKIKNFLEKELIKNKVKFRQENRSYNSHLTLARFQPIKENNQNKLSNYSINRLSFIAQSLDLMESYLKPTGAEYEILKRVDFI